MHHIFPKKKASGQGKYKRYFGQRAMPRTVSQSREEALPDNQDCDIYTPALAQLPGIVSIVVLLGSSSKLSSLTITNPILGETIRITLGNMLQKENIK
jgi:hypothetical protein